MFGNNKLVVDSSMGLHAKLHKCHTMLSIHRIRRAIASGIVGFYFIPGEINPADILSKHWGYAQIKECLKSLLVLERRYGRYYHRKHYTSGKRGVTIFQSDYRTMRGLHSAK
jgi:hypothetical protein